VFCFAGPIPDAVCGMVELQHLILGDNALDGELPPGLFLLPRLWQVRASADGTGRLLLWYWFVARGDCTMSTATAGLLQTQLSMAVLLLLRMARLAPLLAASRLHTSPAVCAA
jgi:hypothetical protein